MKTISEKLNILGVQRFPPSFNYLFPFKNYFQGLFVLVSFYFLSSLFLALALVLSLSLLVVSSLTFRKLSKPRYFCKIRLVWLPPGRRTEEADGSITVQAVCNITVHPLRSAKVGAGMSRTAGRQIF